MKRTLIFAALVVLASVRLSFAQTAAFPNGVIIQPTTCYWTVTVYGGVAPLTANFACLANYNHVGYFSQASGGTATAVVTPALPGTTPIANVNCAQTSPNSTTVACVAPAGQSTITIYGFGY